MKLVFATHNSHKLQEIKKLLPNSIELLSLDDINCTEEIEETAETLKGNSLLKAKYVFDKYKINCFADDSGLEVEALHGAPGVYSARYAGLHKSDDDNNQKLLSELKNEKNRHACFKSVITLILEGEEHCFEGVLRGEILHELIGTEGFGYDPIFKPTGSYKTFAQMDLDEKTKISHRALAVNKLVDFLKQSKL
jgi:XTP/dITP diphosphohydrolase